MPIHRLKHSFSAGELSPLMDARLDFKRFNNGCKKLYNMTCTTQGPATMRPGFKFIFDMETIDLDHANPDFRLIPFIFSEDVAYAMIFYRTATGPINLVFGDKEGLILYADAAQYCPPDPIFEDTYTGDGDYDIDFWLGAADEIAVSIVNGAIDTPLVEGTNYTLTLNAELPHTLTIHAAPTPPVPQPSDVLTVYRLNPHIVGDVVTLEMPAGFQIMEFDWAQSNDEMYIAQEKLPPLVIRRYTPECWEVVSLTFADQPTEWSNVNGWPERVSFHQQRLVYASNTLRPNTVWMSNAGDFYNFGQSGTLISSDAVTFTLDSNYQNKIIWLKSAKSFHIGTIGSEWTVTGSTLSAITPTNVFAQRQTNMGSEPLKPLMIGQTTLFLERYGRSVNEFVYDYTLDSYKVSDMSILSKHVTDQSSIIDWTYQQTPDSVIWNVREDGFLLGITYQRQHEVIGWHVHETNGQFLAITSVPGDTREDEVWVAVKRSLDGVNVYYIEKMCNQFKSDSPKDAEFLDSMVSYSGPPVTSVSGLDHLESRLVTVIADGARHGYRTVVGGSIDLDDEYSDVKVGLPFIAEMWPNLAELPSRDGSSLGRTQRITNVDVNLYNSVGMHIGRYDSEDGEHFEFEPFRTSADNTNEAVPLFTGNKHISFPEGFDENAVYFIRQTHSLPLTIRAVTDIIESYK